jgi:hypothetical protein
VEVGVATKLTSLPQETVLLVGQVVVALLGSETVLVAARH